MLEQERSPVSVEHEGPQNDTRRDQNCASFNSGSCRLERRRFWTLPIAVFGHEQSLPPSCRGTNARRNQPESAAYAVARNKSAF